MDESVTYVGMDTSKLKIALTVLYGGGAGDVDTSLPNEARAVRRIVKNVQRTAPGEVQFCYEAGPCGYALQRQVEGLGSRCKVVAPSLIPIKPGERIKTDRRDGRKLAELLKAGLLTEVRPPTSAEEAAPSCDSSAKCTAATTRAISTSSGAAETSTSARWPTRACFSR